MLDTNGRKYLGFRREAQVYYSFLTFCLKIGGKKGNREGRHQRGKKAAIVDIFQDCFSFSVDLSNCYFPVYELNWVDRNWKTKEAIERFLSYVSFVRAKEENKAAVVDSSRLWFLLSLNAIQVNNLTLVRLGFWGQLQEIQISCSCSLLLTKK